MKKGKIFIISGPSGSGKTTFYKKLLAANSALIKTTSVTTRERRKGELHGRDYFFVSTKMFLFKKKAGHFLESQQVFGNYYGTTNKDIQLILKKGKNVLLCIDVKGARVVRKKYPQAVTIFIKTPNLKVLKKRLEERGSENKAVMLLRLNTAREELNEAKYYDHILINDDFSKAYKKLENIVKEELLR